RHSPSCGPAAYRSDRGSVQVKVQAMSSTRRQPRYRTTATNRSLKCQGTLWGWAMTRWQVGHSPFSGMELGFQNFWQSSHQGTGRSGLDRWHAVAAVGEVAVLAGGPLEAAGDLGAQVLEVDHGVHHQLGGQAQQVHVLLV